MPLHHGPPDPTNHTPKLHKERHIRYWLRCLKTLLPTEYTSNDSNRMLLAFFIVSALDLLSALNSHTTRDERSSYIDWIYRCQHPQGGFRGFPATDFGPDLSSLENAHWDPANLPATYLALLNLVLLGDDLGRVRRRDCLRWLQRLQRDDGSFGEGLGEGGRVEGGSDTRFCHVAAGTRWILRGQHSDGEEDIDVEGLVKFLKSLETYDHGISEAPYHEAHAGFTYCAIGALSFLNRLPQAEELRSEMLLKSDLRFLERTVQWLVSRQVISVEESDDVEDEDSLNQEQFEAAPTRGPSSPSQPGAAQTLPHDASAHRSGPSSTEIRSQTPPAHLKMPISTFAAGFNGRCNKVTDTCYSFWVGGSLAMLHREHLISADRNREFLLNETQHSIGGFGKSPEDPPDVLHSFLGLAALSLLRPHSDSQASSVVIPPISDHSPVLVPPHDHPHAPFISPHGGLPQVSPELTIDPNEAPSEESSRLSGTEPAAPSERPDLKPLDPTMSISCSARWRIENEIWPQWS
ncbi:MAG: hypothetical protein M1837_006796 [Sclerophora amabilis]|nr:MAG: hypothetical protein M1837_006796 [Sclerophora amabilis]